MYPKRFVVIGALALVLTWVVVAVDYSKTTTAVFNISGNVHPVGYYSVKIKIGDPHAERNLRIDSRSGLTWVRCDRRNSKTIENRTVHCMHSACVSIQAGETPTCGIQDRRCHYEIRYTDSSRSMEGLLFFKNVGVHDLSINDRNQSIAIGCGYSGPPSVDGVLGIGKGSAGILHQLQSSGVVMKNIFGHCFRSQGGGGFLTLGYIPTKEIEIGWLTTRNNGRGVLYFWKETGLSKSIQLLFDSGSPYTYFSSRLYNDLLTRDKTMLCLGILDGGDVGIENQYHELVVIGAISMQDKWIVYDNNDETNTRVGWAADNCTKPPTQF